ncbi:MAG: glycosyltransferase family 2 protein [Rectinemataceae bacterium]
MLPLVTILTPTWNRAACLPALRRSLEAQSSRDFEWLVIDDGSSDGTPQLLASWSGTTGFPCRFVRTENGGKHRAINRAMPEVRGEAVFIVDSDDELPPGAMARIAGLWPQVRADAGLVGLVGYRAHRNGLRIGSAFPPSLDRADSLALAWRYGCRGDKAEVFKRRVLLDNPFPEFDGENFLTESVVWNRIAAKGQLLLEPSTLYLCDYLDEGLSSRSLELRVKNPRGAQLYYRELMGSRIPPVPRLRAIANFMRISLLAAIGRLREWRIAGLWLGGDRR